ncbi:MAG TPA: hypothetical protein VGR92_21440 [Steroidobacteraceae bacterium]|nr:hypothetical protein [Steroidobacteraceae bacterium]
MNATLCRSFLMTRKHPRTATFYEKLRWCQLVLAVGAMFLSGPAPAQDACAMQCYARQAAWCDGTEFACPFDAQICIKQQCERPAPSPLHGPIPTACQIAQNALRPCTNQPRSDVPAGGDVPTGVDGRLVGTWEIVTPTPVGVARWVWEIHKDGTYRFHAEGPGAVQAHSGTFAASKGRYVLNSKTMDWNDAGTYRLADGATLFAAGKLGPGTWHRVQPKATGHGETQRITVRK